MTYRPLPLALLLGSSAALAWSTGGHPEGEDRAWDAQHLNLDLRIDPHAGTVQGVATWTVAPKLGADAPWRLDQIGLDVSAVTVDGATVTPILEDGALTVPLDPASPHQVALTYSAKPRSGLHFRAPGPKSPDTYTEVWSQGEDIDNRHWFPLPDGPEDRFTVSGTVRVPEGFTTLTVGDNQTPSAGVTTFKLDKPIVGYLVALTVLPADAQSVVVSTNPPIAVWTGPGVSPSLLASDAATLPKMMAFFEEKIGTPFPWPQYREVYVQRFIYGGMENPSLTVMARGLLGEGDSPLITPERENVSAHELAHQWYGDLLTCRSWSELWLNEGFATFFASEWMRASFGEAEYARDTLGQAASAASAGPMASRSWSTPKGDHAVNDRVYARGAAVLRMLRALVGEEAFWASIARYTRENAWGLVETEDLRRAFEEETGQRLRWFFDQWVHLPGAPEITVSDRHEKGTLFVRLSQKVPEGRAPWILPIDVEIGTAAGVMRRTVWLDEATVELAVDLAEPPTYVAVDPAGVIVGALSHEQGTARLIAQLGSPSPAARMRAVRALGDGKADARAVAPLVALLSDPDPVWAEEAAGALGNLDTPEGNASLGAALGDPTRPTRVRVAAARALGAGTGQGGARELLLRAWKTLRDPGPLAHEALADAVLRAIRPHDRAFAVEESKKILNKFPRTTWHAPRHVGALSVLSREGKLPELKLVLRYVQPEVPPPMLFEAIRAAVRIAAREEGDHPEVARAIEPLLDDAFQDTRAAALAALGEVGDDTTLRLVERYADIEDTPWLREQAKRTAAAIRARSNAPPPEEAEINARLDELDKRLDELNKDLDQLKTRR